MNTHAQIEDTDLPAPAGGQSSKPTVVLVHGALEGASIWHLVIPRLQREGFPVIAFANPLRSLGVDVAYLRSVLDRIEGQVILVSHAYGGAVITQAGDDPKVLGLVYAASPMPAVGESATDCLERFPGGDFGSSVNLTTYTLPDGTTGMYALVQGDRYGSLLAADVPESVLALMIATQRPVDLAALNEKLTSAAWATKPSWQIRPLRDPVFALEEWKFESDRAGSHVTEVNSSHAVPVTHPDVVVDVIKQAADATMREKR
jgi:pimeloyl-ACP methyl ester carboxylesterase